MNTAARPDQPPPSAHWRIRWQEPPFFLLLVMFFFGGVFVERLLGPNRLGSSPQAGAPVVEVGAPVDSKGPVARLPEIADRIRTARKQVEGLERDIKENEIIQTLMADGPRTLNEEEKERLGLRQEELRRALAKSNSALESLVKLHDRLVGIKDTQSIQSIAPKVGPETTPVTEGPRGELIYGETIIGPPPVNWGKESIPAVQESEASKPGTSHATRIPHVGTNRNLPAWWPLGFHPAMTMSPEERAEYWNKEREKDHPHSEEPMPSGKAVPPESPDLPLEGAPISPSGTQIP
jgi:hypothetical protein